MDTVARFLWHGFVGTLHSFTASMRIPAFVAFLVIAAESAGVGSLLFGFMTRFAANCGARKYFSTGTIEKQRV